MRWALTRAIRLQQARPIPGCPFMGTAGEGALPSWGYHGQSQTWAELPGLGSQVRGSPPTALSQAGLRPMYLRALPSSEAGGGPPSALGSGLAGHRGREWLGTVERGRRPVGWRGPSCSPGLRDGSPSSPQGQVHPGVGGGEERPAQKALLAIKAE